MNRLLKGFTRRYLPSFYKRNKFGIFNEVQMESLIETRLFEPELLLLKNFINKNNVVFDIGANAGEYTYVFEKLVGASHVYSFEPVPKLFYALKKLFPNIHLYKIALSNKDDIVQFKIPIIDGRKFERGKLDIDYIEPGELSSELIEVECKTLDLLVREDGISQIDFIKIDVEGHELKVLNGADGSIRQFRPIILIEIEQRHHNFSINKIFDHIQSLDYTIQFYDLNSLLLKDIHEFNIELAQDYKNIKTSNYINNFWCFPREG